MFRTLNITVFAGCQKGDQFCEQQWVHFHICQLEWWLAWLQLASSSLPVEWCLAWRPFLRGTSPIQSLIELSVFTECLAQKRQVMHSSSSVVFTGLGALQTHAPRNSWGATWVQLAQCTLWRNIITLASSRCSSQDSAAILLMVSRRVDARLCTTKWGSSAVCHYEVMSGFVCVLFASSLVMWILQCFPLVQHPLVHNPISA